MPSKNNLHCFVPETNSKSTQDFISRDIDDLVFEIKENLRLKARPSHIVNSKSRLRSTPYMVPTRTEKCGCCHTKTCLKRNGASSVRKTTDDPYEALQELLKDGDLIKEAVRRLQLGLSTTNQQQRCVFYDSDDELRTPPYPFKDIEV